MRSPLATFFDVPSQKRSPASRRQSDQEPAHMPVTIDFSHHLVKCVNARPDVARI
jgi:hypothetical protein